MRVRKVLTALFLCASVFPADAQEKTAPFPYTAEYYVIATGWGADVLQLSVLPTVFDMDVSSIILNRGNCQVLENRVVDNRFVLVAFPQILKFGLKRTFWSQANCVPREMIISTIEGGKFTMTFTDK